VSRVVFTVKVAAASAGRGARNRAEARAAARIRFRIVGFPTDEPPLHAGNYEKGPNKGMGAHIGRPPEISWLCISLDMQGIAGMYIDFSIVKKDRQFGW
jgi:hypothetical protein